MIFHLIQELEQRVMLELQWPVSDGFRFVLDQLLLHFDFIYFVLHNLSIESTFVTPTQIKTSG